ncbi:MAG: hypothetical protein OXG50_13790, partial [bacterium]|nr:hypothetical protein [bacterium]
GVRRGALVRVHIQSRDAEGQAVDDSLRLSAAHPRRDHHQQRGRQRRRKHRSEQTSRSPERRPPPPRNIAAEQERSDVCRIPLTVPKSIT